ncbi:myelin transcription factor 1-like isoform X1 [Odontomachus brunneus]|uniref:myelin transcription factor 1-like isoform X1 n=1 Tax=Odontomachus brunneus TaxID=486640 RepID=UPI0013F1CFD1|nr:myelin transcription factor 1-like isoform X1 [Odontomachus brunneus]
MFMFAFLSTFLVLSRIRTVGDGPDRDSSGMHDSNIIIRNILRHPLNVESAFYVNSLQLSRRLLEYPRWIKQAYRSTDYNVVQKRHRARNKPDDGRSYRSALKDDEDEDEDEDEENENEDDEEDKISDETIGEAADETEQANADEEDEETVEDAGRTCITRSGYVPLMGKVDDRDRQEVVRIRSASEECEDSSTEALQYYEYETEVRDAVSQGGGEFRKATAAKMVGGSLLIFLLT